VVFSESSWLGHATTTRIFFDDQGDLVRLLPDGARFWRERLDLGSGPPRWVPAGTQTLPKLSPDSIHTGSHRWAVDYNGEGPHLYDLQTGEAKDDPWLEAILTDYRARTKVDLGNSGIWLTDDLNHLVIMPNAWRQNSPNPEHLNDQLITAFRDGGQSYAMQDYALAYDRPALQSRVFHKPAGKMNATNGGVKGVFVIQGELLMLTELDGIDKLADLDGATHFQVAMPAHVGFGNVIQQADQDRLFFVDPEDLWNVSPSGLPLHVVDITAWYYLDGRVEHQRLNLEDIFTLSLGQYRPVKAEAIAN
jgi:hypothetical protein